MLLENKEAADETSAQGQAPEKLSKHFFIYFVSPCTNFFFFLQEAAKAIWQRSEEKYKLRYTEMLSDGDSASYASLCEESPYPVQKLECLNHASKRMGTALRKLAKDEKLGGRGEGRLTAAKCDELQKYYYGAIIDNLPDVARMKNAIYGTLWHSMSTDEEPRHHMCPRGENSWCFYQRAEAQGEEPPSHTEHRTKTRVCKEVAHKMIPVYRRMADDVLLKRLAHGGTQNTNECLNSLIWSICPKTAFMGQKRVRGAVARAVCVFNQGASELMSVMSKLQIDISGATLAVVTARDKRRTSKADSDASAASRERRKEGAAQRRRQVRQQEAMEGVTYEAGTF